MCGPDRPSTIKKSILMEGQIFDFWGDFTGEALRTLTFLERFLNNLDFSPEISTKTLLPPTSLNLFLQMWAFCEK